jgi:hypothetical protein
MVIKRMIYWLGFRPGPGSVFYSPSLSWFYPAQDAMKKRGENH